MRIVRINNKLTERFRICSAASTCCNQRRHCIILQPQKYIHCFFKFNLVCVHLEHKNKDANDTDSLRHNTSFAISPNLSFFHKQIYRLTYVLAISQKTKIILIQKPLCSISQICKPISNPANQSINMQPLSCIMRGINCK